VGRLVEYAPQPTRTERRLRGGWNRRWYQAAPRFIALPATKGARGEVKLTYALIGIYQEGVYRVGTPETLGFSGGTTETFTATQTWTCPSVGVNGFDVLAVNAECRGGGGGGGSANVVAGPGSGGTGGAFAKKDNISTTPATGYTVTVGAASAAGGVGNDSWFSTTGTVLAKGGIAGQAGALNNPGDARSNSAQAAACVGDTIFIGGSTIAASATNSSGGGGGAGDSGNGGDSTTSAGGTAGSAGGGVGGAPTTPSNPGAPGGGGGGAGLINTGATVGARGQVQLNYLRKFKKTFPVRLGLVPVLDRKITAHRTLSVALLGRVSLTKAMRKTLSVTLALRVSLAKFIQKVLSVRIGLVPTFDRRIAAHRTLTVALLLRTTIIRKIGRTLTVVLRLVPTLQRFLRAARTLAVTLALRVQGFVKISFEVLSRITGGGGTTIVRRKKLIVDD
jgi:hypothetical protein